MAEHSLGSGHDAVGLLPTAGVALAVIAGVLYLWAVGRPSSNGRRRPGGRTAAYLGGVALLVLALFTSAGDNDDELSVHIGRHMVLMMAVAPLLVAGEPLRLLLGALQRERHLALVEVMCDPVVRALTAGRWTGVLLAADYYGSMAVYLHTPLLRWSSEHMWIHVVSNIYFLLCGWLFWSALLGRDPAGWQPSRRAKLVMAAVGVPFNALLGWSLSWRMPDLGGHGAAEVGTAAWVTGIVGGLLSLAGVLVVARRPFRGRRKPVHREERWPVVS
ncbi:hypothetical protein GCM10017786_08170 [Amycolatopsis deserti]|uniref:Cytochrome c oxidase assembly protein n=1 Tax=Amycolatopsis deserti TaxID=185696 RepID=A0ABQ3IDL6_9PSEU|nr:cytochrome c oxidase assembly protein [Amycolatopsis deserti]GHE80422.1 hypothetical protein GCM10017786_08170 [Amycolatopsis deserti]